MSRSSRTEYGKSAQRKDEVTRAAIAIVDESGHEALTVAAVAARVGMPLATVIYHFPTRAHLLAATMAMIDDMNFDAERSAYIDHEESNVPIEIVAKHLATMGMDAPNRMRLRAHLWGDAFTAEHPAYAYLKGATDRGVEAVSAFLRDRQAAGLAHPDLDPERAARRILAAWEGLQMQWLRDPTFDLATEVHDAIRQLTRQDVMDARQVMEDAIRSI